MFIHLASGQAFRSSSYDYNTFVSCRVVIARVVKTDSEEAGQYPVGFGVRIVDISSENRERLKDILSRVEQGENLY